MAKCPLFPTLMTLLMGFNTIFMLLSSLLLFDVPSLPPPPTRAYYLHNHMHVWAGYVCMRVRVLLFVCVCNENMFNTNLYSFLNVLSAFYWIHQHRHRVSVLCQYKRRCEVCKRQVTKLFLMSLLEWQRQQGHHIINKLYNIRYSCFMRLTVVCKVQSVDMEKFVNCIAH